MTDKSRKKQGQIVLWKGKSWAVRLTVIAVLACLVKGVIDWVSGKNISEEFTFLFAIAIPGGALIGSVIDGVQKGHEKEKFKSRKTE
ncbi:MAG: hypothetical protein OXB86_06870 [Bdellovibrionales bacterium]|nr:hypothetical protein [Bdellovibrionales bacterium]